MAGRFEPSCVPHGPPSRQNEDYEQACDVRLAFELENAQDHTHESTDAGYPGSSVDGRQSIQPRRVVCILSALGLCVLVGLATVALTFCYRSSSNTEAMLVSINNKLEVNGRALQDVIFTLITSKLWGSEPVWQKSGPRPNDTGSSVTSIDVTDMRRNVVEMTDRIADDIITQRMGGTTYQPSPLPHDVQPYGAEEVPKVLQMEVQACEYDTLTMGCAYGQRINILSALYGRTDVMACPGGMVHTRSCRSPYSLAQVRALCQGRSTCSVQASNDVFGDPCVATYKYLVVRYACLAEGSARSAGCPSWTPWYDRDDPSATGDFETLRRLRRENLGEICFKPSTIEARVKGSNVPASHTGDRLSIYDSELGLACSNNEQEDRRQCKDYEVRFCCP
ncbi:CILP2 [Branchiostoma lanceolatum]|uniref:CILP2 protein n=1 Tax=Branchiostoma lanceolatum TaxID=7740 RepID=A0A8J9ZDY0_BRALA|nr:CILP2 [Branchiostoma lanceolatum]